MFRTLSLALISGLIGFSVHAQSPTLDDAQIAEVVLVINEGEVDAAQTASRKASTPEVKDFAKTMESSHKTSTKDIKALAKKVSIKPAKSEYSKSLTEEGKTAHKDLKKHDKDEFDKFYIDQQVVMHGKALDALDKTLIPNAKNSEFKAWLEKTRAEVAMHLEQAKNLQSKLQ